MTVPLIKMSLFLKCLFSQIIEIKTNKKKKDFYFKGLDKDRPCSYVFLYEIENQGYVVENWLFVVDIF